jgi:hypothetical protein
MRDANRARLYRKARRVDQYTFENIHTVGAAELWRCIPHFPDYEISTHAAARRFGRGRFPEFHLEPWETCHGQEVSRHAGRFSHLHHHRRTDHHRREPEGALTSL